MRDIISDAVIFLLEPLQSLPGGGVASDQCETSIGEVRSGAGAVAKVSHQSFILFPPGFLEDFGSDSMMRGYLLEGEEYLGRYHHMRSPGAIELHARRLQWFFWRLIAKLTHMGQRFMPTDMEPLARIVVLKTWIHEQFHLYSDIQRRLFYRGPSPANALEEALASAHSKREIQSMLGRVAFSELRQSLLRPFIQEAYDYGNMPGYSDWPHYAEDMSFQTGLLNLFAHPEASFLEASGVPLGRFLQEQLKVIKYVHTENVLTI